MEDLGRLSKLFALLSILKLEFVELAKTTSYVEAHIVPSEIESQNLLFLFVETAREQFVESVVINYEFVPAGNDVEVGVIITTLIYIGMFDSQWSLQDGYQFRGFFLVIVEVPELDFLFRGSEKFVIAVVHDHCIVSLGLELKEQFFAHEIILVNSSIDGQQ